MSNQQIHFQIFYTSSVGKRYLLTKLSVWLSKGLFLYTLLFMLSCRHQDEGTPDTPPVPSQPAAFTGIKTINDQQVSVDLVIEKPAKTEVDVLLLFHGTVMSDNKILDAAQTTLTNFKNILNMPDFMLVSVAYPEENLIMGDNLKHCEVALRWVKEHAEKDMGTRVRKIFLAGHSQGGYLVTRLNALHSTDGVVANAPGPLNLVYRCQLEEQGQIQNSSTCTQLRAAYGTTAINPDAYMQRSLLNYTSGFKSDILFVQGLADTPIQLYSWPLFTQQVQACSNCAQIHLLEVPGQPHGALFTSPEAKLAFNTFLAERM